VARSRGKRLGQRRQHRGDHEDLREKTKAAAANTATIARGAPVTAECSSVCTTQ
jgi:hypothetical protein